MEFEPSYSDLFNLRACDENVNSSRGNKYYDATTTNGTGYAFPAHIEVPLCSTDSDSWETPLIDRGNIARLLFYMVTRYNGDVANEPALQPTDNPALITTANASMGKLTTLLQWHNSDPVNAEARLRNDRIYSHYQTNRNPFVDRPEWVNLIFAPAYTNRPSLNVTLAGNRSLPVRVRVCNTMEVYLRRTQIFLGRKSNHIYKRRVTIVAWKISRDGNDF